MVTPAAAPLGACPAARTRAAVGSSRIAIQHIGVM